MLINNKTLQLKYLLDLDYIYKYNLKSSYQTPKIESISITLIQQSEKEIDFALQDIQVKNIFLFYSLLNKIPVTKVIPKKISKGGLLADTKTLYMQKLLIKQPAYISRLLNFFFLGKNFSDYIEDALLSNNLSTSKTSLTIKYPLAVVYESFELNSEFDISIKDMNFFVKITFDRLVTKTKINNIIYFG